MLKPIEHFPSLLRNARKQVATVTTNLARRFGWVPFDWEGGLSDEVAFWKDALSDPDAHWNREDFDLRMDPDLPLQPELRDLLPAYLDEGTTVRILDVGAGPLTRVGRNWPGHQVEVIAVDPLADEYDIILGNLGITPPHRTITCRGEDLAARFSEESFHICYASNALDHALSPPDVIRQMGTLAKKGGVLYLWHFLNCGIEERYHGLHQWNFALVGNDLSIDNGRESQKLSHILGPRFSIDCHVERAFDADVAVAVARKTSDQ